MVTTILERAFRPAACSCNATSVSGRMHARAVCMMSSSVLAFKPASFGSRFNAARPSLRQVAQRRASSAVKAAAAPPKGKEGPLLSATEVPAFIPRDDFADQMLRWAYMEQADGAAQKWGMPVEIEEVFREDDGRLWGSRVSFLRNGQPATTLYCGFDDDVLLKHEWMGMDDLGFPVPEGNMSEVQGRNYEIRKVCDCVADDEVKQTLRTFCKSLVSTINRYYAFGSVFAAEGDT